MTNPVRQITLLTLVLAVLTGSWVMTAAMGRGVAVNVAVEATGAAAEGEGGGGGSGSAERSVQGIMVVFEGAAGATDRRTDHRAALYVPADEPPTPFLEPGPFTATWRGKLNVPMRDRYRFAFEGRGWYRLTINDDVVLQVDAAVEGDRVVSDAVRLNQGANELVAEYRSPDSGDAAARLLWSSPDFPLEPVRPDVLTHDGSDTELADRQRLRQGRALLAELRCFRCHTPPADLVGDTAMPELAMDSPAIMDVGVRLREAWLAEWMLDPHAMRHDATMPRFFHGDESEQAVRDVAAYLKTLRFGAVADAADPVPDDAATIARGGELYASLGCVGCHEIRGQEPVADRISLADIGGKFYGPALREYMMNPAQRFAHARMGNFKLSRDEADAVAAFLLDQSTEPAEAAGGGDADRGQLLVRQSGCINCHALPVPSTLEAPELQRLLGGDWARGCLAEDAEQRGAAPELPLDPDEREALRALKQAGVESLSRTNRMELAQRQMHRLQCNACHTVEDRRDAWSTLSWQVSRLAPPPPEGPAGTPPIEQTRPSLVWAGEMLRPDWMRGVLRGDHEQKARPWLRARMPTYATAASQGLAEGMAMLHGLSPESKPLQEPDPQLAQVGERLVSQRWGFSCTDCHAVGDHPAQNIFGAIGIDFDVVAQRMRYGFYHQWMYDPSRITPRTKMPRYTDEHGYTALTDVLDGDGPAQFEAIWHYLLTQPESRPRGDR